MGLPGTGLSYTEVESHYSAAHPHLEAALEPARVCASRAWLWVVLAIALAAAIALWAGAQMTTKA